jgi:hypothetical protein
MTNELDLPTVLLLQKTSYIAGALTLGYWRLTSAESRGVGILAASFIVLAAGSTLAGVSSLQDLRPSKSEISVCPRNAARAMLVATKLPISDPAALSRSASVP